MTKWPKHIKTKARALRKSGLSYGDISKKLGVSKSTLHSWIHDIKRSKGKLIFDNLKHLKEIRKLAAAANTRKRQERLEIIKQRVRWEVGKYQTNRIDYKRSLLVMLYWAEGAKTRGSVIFANTDPELSLLFISLLRQCYKINEEKLRVRLHLHWYHPIKKTRKFWSELLDIPESKFGKIHMKKRSKTKKFRRNFVGICFIKYYSEDLKYEILETAKQVSRKLVPVAQRI